MPSSGQLAIYCNRAKSFHLESPGPESCKICSHLMQKNKYTPTVACLCSHKVTISNVNSTAAGSPEMSVNFYQATYCHAPVNFYQTTYCHAPVNFYQTTYCHASLNFYQATYCHAPHNSILHTHCGGGVLNKLCIGRSENKYWDQVRKSANKIAGKGMVQYNSVSMFVTASTDRTVTDIRITNTGIYCHCDMPNWFLNLQNTCNMNIKYPQITQNKEQFTFSKIHFWKHKTILLPWNTFRPNISSCRHILNTNIQQYFCALINTICKNLGNNRYSVMWYFVF